MTNNNKLDANDKIQVSVETEFLPQQSDPEDNKFVFAYHITIENNDATDVKLLNRYWLITDGDGNKSEVAGSGVIGQQPIIKPGKKHQYSSGCVLETPVGTMEGYYEMQLPDNSLVKAIIPVFSLSQPNIIH